MEQPLISKQFRRNTPDGSLTRSNGIWEEMPEPDTWDFVVEFYPNYQGSENILASDDLDCVIDGQRELEEFYRYHPDWKDLTIEELKQVQKEWDAEIYKAAKEYLEEAIKTGEIEVREFSN